jgi:hypothetical protein
MDGEVANEQKLISFSGLHNWEFSQRLSISTVPVLFLEKFIQYSPEILKLIIS